MRKLITARALKNKRTARMLANARKDHSIPYLVAVRRGSTVHELHAHVLFLVIIFLTSCQTDQSTNTTCMVKEV